MGAVKYKFSAIVVCEFETHTESHKKSKLNTTELLLELSDNLERNAYFDETGMPKKDAIKPLSEVLVSGLASNIHYAHQNGMWDSAEHLRYVIMRLEQLFVTQGNAERAIMSNPKADPNL